jgi:large subunit ribosomal protein L29
VETKELRECTAERLADLEKQLRRQIFDARIKNHTNQLDDTASIRRMKRDLARVKTISVQKTNEPSADTAEESNDG